MRTFHCTVCEQMVFFENSLCLHCLSGLGFDPDRREVVTVVLEEPLDSGAVRRVGDDKLATDEPVQYRCTNDVIAKCNWLVPAPGKLCVSCALTQTRPDDGDDGALAEFADAEAAKRRLVFTLLELRLPIEGHRTKPDGGLAFDLLSPGKRPVQTGHADGVITLNLDEANDAHREQVRSQMGEPYRTLLGHFRHEVGHYYWPIVIEQTGLIDDYRKLFGDEREDYGKALERHYEEGPPVDWAKSHVSSYATMHPWEDWAETWAHYLHIVDTSQTAAAHELQTDLARPGDTTDLGFRMTLRNWIPFTYAMNAICRSMGIADLYPFVITKDVITKLVFVDRAVTSARFAAAKKAAAQVPAPPA
ncbi:hypothetical protein DSM112329_01040 [Paraconexibacter sp. AEG42_29]|uniref:Zinc-ribbon domain-containing protein n=1 Tax=Paraconexibacter sp. AEG42_29 TaxID=2997339 RepID=A0AAU7ARK1_9ACTN